MVSSAEFDSNLIDLVGIYHEAHGSLQRTNVYANGIMQVMLFLSVNYRGDATGLEETIKRHVHDHAVIYQLNDNNGLQDEVTYEKSYTSNGCPHDIEYPGVMKNDSPKSTSDIRAPFFFIVPFNSPTGTFKWIGELNSKQTKTHLTVEVRPFTVSADYFEIESRGLYMKAELRVLKYKDGKFGANQVLYKVTPYKGIKFDGANSWIAMVDSNSAKAGAFVEYRNTKPRVAENSYIYSSRNEWAENGDRIPFAHKRLTSSYGWEDGIYIPEDAVDAAWKEGIVMIKIAQHSLGMTRIDSYGYWLENWREYEFEILDTLGNRIFMSINWNAGDWFGTWTVHQAYPVPA
ncbi:PREDICTED: uncharacterized protein LOC109586711 [Amphimedon queenslandica]|uniref:Uncharacterized protein n=1 Tax=Amphimedon queenslandica TaxID=400682 RepID=A0A1X7TPQ1_AMPQE|nr:PREDICTED: uncharacterized protein LOC109586711 [Amphimedon queenslandica]|eukprot:XP_019858480.1 PREDICTED: uncharacterized protein LOC109586711 [Amphimedon queenslandica]